MSQQPSYIELPKSIKVVGSDGKITEQKMNLPKHVSPCGGCLNPPDMGWYGPFGLLRIISIVFWVLFVTVTALSVCAFLIGDIVGACFGGLLALGSALASLAAASHEGLSLQVGQMAQQNDRFAENNDQLENQLDDLEGVRQKLEEHEKKLGDQVGMFTEFVERFHKVNNMLAVTTLLAAYLDADSLYGDRNKSLEGKECAAYFSSATPILKEAFPDYDIKNIEQLAIKNGFDLWGCRLMAAAVVHADNVAKSNAALGLLLFSLDGDQEKCVDQVSPAAEGVYETVEIQAFLTKWKADAHGGLVPRSSLVPLCFKLMKNEQTSF